MNIHEPTRGLNAWETGAPAPAGSSPSRDPEAHGHASPSVSAVVPVYNSETTLPELVSRLAATLSARTSPFEIILVNDSSRDASWDVITRLANNNPAVRGINLMRNFGQHNALLAGIRAARHELIVTLDDDLQNPPEELPVLLRALTDGVDVVYGAPQHQQHGRLRNSASRVVKFTLEEAMGVETARNVSAFRVFRTRLRTAFDGFQSPFVSIDALLTWGTTRFAAVSVQHDKRGQGRSGYSFRKLMGHALNVTTSFSTVPLRIASAIGFVFTMFGCGVLVYVVARNLAHGSSVPGFTFLACLLAVFSGAQLFALGIIGEYLARVHFRVMERPNYVVRDVVSSASRPPDTAGVARCPAVAADGNEPGQEVSSGIA